MTDQQRNEKQTRNSPRIKVRVQLVPHPDADAAIDLIANLVLKRILATMKVNASEQV